jgi:hypothetical protein
MNSSRLLLAITTLAFFLTLAFSPVHAGSMGNGFAQRMKLVVDSIDVAGGTVVLKSQVDNSLHTYKIGAATKIMVGRSKGTIDQIQVGQKVANLATAGGTPPETLKVLMLYAATPAPAAPAAN